MLGTNISQISHKKLVLFATLLCPRFLAALNVYYYALTVFVRCEAWNESHVFQAPRAGSVGLDAVLPEPSPCDLFQAHRTIGALRR
jgi:hypothetical protein